MKKRWWFSVCLCLLFSLSACGQTSTTPRAKGLVVGLDDSFVPMGFRDEDGQLKGFDVDLANAVFALTDEQVTFQPIDWSMKESELANGTIDMIWNGYSITDKRRDKVRFSQTYMQNQQVLVTLKDSRITQVDQMTQQRLGMQEGSSSYNVFVDQPDILQARVKGQDTVLYMSVNEAFLDLTYGRIDGLLIDKVYAEYYITQKQQADTFQMIDTPYQQEDFAVGVRKEDKALATKINDGMQQLRANGTFATISKKWFGKDVSPK